MPRWILSLIALSTAGCLIVPTGEIKLDHRSRRPIPDSLIDSLDSVDATRIDVLLGLGAPDLVLESERIFVYQWATQSGFIIADGGGGELNVHVYDRVFIFDDGGRVVASGDLKTLMEEGYWRDKPLDLECPPDIGVVISRTFSRSKVGRMILEEDEMRIELTDDAATTITIPRGGVLELDYRTTGEKYHWPDARTFELRFRDRSGKVKEKTIHVEVRSLITLTRYLHQHSPEITIRY